MYVEIGLKFLERKGKNVEIHIRTDGQILIAGYM